MAAGFGLRLQWVTMEPTLPPRVTRLVWIDRVGQLRGPIAVSLGRIPTKTDRDHDITAPTRVATGPGSGDDAGPGVSIRGGLLTLGTVPAEVAPGAERPRAGREDVVAGPAGGVGRIGPGGVEGDRAGLGHLPGQPGLGRLVPDDGAGGQVVQFDPGARAPQRAGRADHVHRQREA